MINKFDGKYSFLSNFYIDSLPNVSVENRYQASKTNNIEQKQAILNAPTAAMAKKMGRKVDMRHDWEEVKSQIMWELIWYKFQVPFLKDLLLSTDEEELVEGNYWHDNYWGICSCNKCVGKEAYNVLGKLLMHRRRWCKGEDLVPID